MLACAFVRSLWERCPRGLAPIGAVHGAVALVLFGVAVTAAMRAPKPVAAEEPGSRHRFGSGGSRPWRAACRRGHGLLLL